MADAQPAQQATETGVKAAYLYRFAAYIDWPEGSFGSPGAPLVIGVMGADDVATELAQIATGRQVATHPVTTRRLAPGDALKGVSLLFVGRSLSAELPAIVKAAQQAGALVVTESRNGLEAGSAINFVLLGDRVGFEVSLDAAQRGGHHISSRMLALAQRVVQRPL